MMKKIRSGSCRRSGPGISLPRSLVPIAVPVLTPIMLTMGASAAAQTDDMVRPAPPAWSVAAEFELEYEAERNFNLDDEDEQDEAIFQPGFNLGLAWRPTPRLQGFVRLELLRDYAVGGSEAETGETRLQLAEAFLSIDRLASFAHGELSLDLGRKLSRDERQWLTDEQLDGLTLRYDRDPWALSFSVTRQRSKDLFERESTEEADNYLALGSYQFDDRTLGVYALKRRERDDAEGRPLFIGLQSFGEFGQAIDYWLELSLVRDHEAAGSVRGWGTDLGATWRMRAPLSPSLTLGYAFGSGDADPDDGVNRAFRQSGMQDNESDLGDLVGFRYLGVLLEPELSNLGVLTAGIGLRPHERSSAHLLFHHYRQDEASETLRDTNIDADPNGIDRDLGQGIDLVVGAEIGDSVEIEAVVGYFTPGRAFDDENDDAFLFSTKIEYGF